MNFWRRANSVGTKFGGGGKIGIGKRGRGGQKRGCGGKDLPPRPSDQFLPREARQSIGISFKKGSRFVQQLRPIQTFQIRTRGGEILKFRFLQ